MKNGKKVYWVNGWPNNGRGYYICWLFGWHLVKDESGKLIICDTVKDLKKSIEQKERLVKYTEEGTDSSDTIRGMMEGNKYEIELGKKFLNQC